MSEPDHKEDRQRAEIPAAISGGGSDSNMSDTNPRLPFASFSMAHALSIVRRRKEEEEKAKAKKLKALEEESKEKAKAKRKRRRQNQKLAKSKIKTRTGSPSGSHASETGSLEDNKLDCDNLNGSKRPRDDEEEASHGDLNDKSHDSSAAKPPKKKRKKKRSRRPRAKSGDDVTALSEGISSPMPVDKFNLFIPRALMIKKKG